MAKNKISEFSSTAANNTDIGGINISEGCAPSGINNAIRELMSQLKDQQAGTDSDSFTVGGGFTCTGAAVFSSTVAVAGVATFTSAPVFPASVALIPSGGIIMWSGSIASIPSGWLLCNGSNGTPDLRNRFVVGAGSTYSVNGTGGSADAIVVSHTHTATVTDPGHLHTTAFGYSDNHDYFGNNVSSFTVNGQGVTQNPYNYNSQSASTGISVSNSTTGSSGTNANLPPYYALAYIMKS
jgi:hypothetical protein